jgi:hypothetical protein
MEKQKLKRTILFLGALFVAIIFVTSYAAFDNNGTNLGKSTTTTPQGRTLPVFGAANAVIENYSYFADVGVSANEVTAVNATLDALVSNGTVSSYYYSNSSYRVVLSNINPYGLYLLLHNSTKGTNATVGAQAYVKLPTTISVYYGSSYAVPVSLLQPNYTVYIANVVPINSTVHVNVIAQINQSGDIYHNQLKLSQVLYSNTPTISNTVNTPTTTLSPILPNTPEPNAPTTNTPTISNTVNTLRP